ncbi:hypothetical protein BC828DRAFT_408293 [Blastocladiella britannica]|nr:hypothetical protein BC828DRAFT_408293 [Blastocladiella britannica]
MTEKPAQPIDAYPYFLGTSGILLSVVLPLLILVLAPVTMHLSRSRPTHPPSVATSLGRLRNVTVLVLFKFVLLDLVKSIKAVFDIHAGNELEWGVPIVHYTGQFQVEWHRALVNVTAVVLARRQWGEYITRVSEDMGHKRVAAVETVEEEDGLAMQQPSTTTVDAVDPETSHPPPAHSPPPPPRRFGAKIVQILHDYTLPAGRLGLPILQVGLAVTAVLFALNLPASDLSSSTATAAAISARALATTSAVLSVAGASTSAVILAIGAVSPTAVARTVSALIGTSPLGSSTTRRPARVVHAIVVSGVMASVVATPLVAPAAISVAFDQWPSFADQIGSAAAVWDKFAVLVSVLEVGILGGLAIAAAVMRGRH